MGRGRLGGTSMVDLSDNALKVKKYSLEIADLMEDRLLADNYKEKQKISSKIAYRRRQIRKLKGGIDYATKVVGDKPLVKILKNRFGQLYVKEMIKTKNRHGSWRNKWVTRSLTQKEHQEYMKGLKK